MVLRRAEQACGIDPSAGCPLGIIEIFALSFDTREQGADCWSSLRPMRRSSIECAPAFVSKVHRPLVPSMIGIGRGQSSGPTTDWRVRAPFPQLCVFIVEGYRSVELVPGRHAGQRQPNAFGLRTRDVAPAGLVLFAQGGDERIRRFISRREVSLMPMLISARWFYDPRPADSNPKQA